jgi:hypothetical protein
VLALLAPALLAAGSTAQAAALQNGPGRYAPRDECARLPGATAFRAALARAAKRRDVEALVALASPNVELDFGGGAGREELRRQLRGAEGRERWQALDRMLPLGCAAQRGNLVLPWFFAQEIGDLEPYDTLLVTGARVPLRSRPSATAPVLLSLTWQLTELVPPDDGRGPYRHVRLPGTRISGYVATAKLRSPVDYRLIAGRSGGRWRIDAFIAGD